MRSPSGWLLFTVFPPLVRLYRGTKAPPYTTYPPASLGVILVAVNVEGLPDGLTACARAKHIELAPSWR